MQPNPVPARRWLLPAAVLLLLAACGESQPADVDDGTPPGSGGAGTPPGSGGAGSPPGNGGAGSPRVTLTVRVTSTGAWPDRNGFVLTVDGLAAKSFGTEGVRVQLAPGPHRVALDEVASNCTVTDNPREVELAAGTPSDLAFSVTCHGGTMHWLLRAARGDEVDPDGYEAQLWFEEQRVGPLVRVRERDTSLTLEVPAGEVAARLSGIWWSCPSASPDSSVTVPKDAAASLEVAPVCRPVGGGRRGMLMSDGENMWRFDHATGAYVSLGRGYAPSWSPDGQRIAFALPEQFAHDFFSLAGASVMDANGRLLVQAFAESPFPRILPDGRLLANDSVFDADGRLSATPLWRMPAGYRVLDWDRELSTLLVARSTMDPRTGDQLGPDTLALAAADGRLLHVLWVSRGLMMKARFAPDGRRIAVNLDSPWSMYERSSYNNMCGADCGIWVLERDGSRRFRIAGRAARDFTPEGAYFDYGPLAWSPESARVLYARGDFAKGYELVHARADDGGDVQLVWRSKHLPYADWR